MAALSLRRITKRFGGAAVLSAVDLSVEDGELLVVVGPSGCGKSTLLRVVAGLEAADEGDVLLDGANVNDREPVERDVAMVFQSYALYPHRTVRGNLSFPLEMRRLPRAEIERRVARTAALLGLEPLLARKPATLSGGQMQRVALGRAIVRAPRLFLFDEPLSNLDAVLRGEMRAELARLHAELGVTSLYVTHDQAEAMTLGRRICVLEAGRVRQVGTPLEVYERPADAFVAAFLGSPPMNIVGGRVESGAFRCGPLLVPGAPGRDGAEVLLGVRPHDVSVGAQPHDLASGRATELRVRHVERLGDRTHLALDLGTEELVAACEGDVRASPGERVPARLDPARLHWFDAASGARVR